MKRARAVATREAVARVVALSETGYSFDRYASWSACAAMLLRRGYSELEAAAILLSKYPRWAADASDQRYGRVTAATLATWLDANDYGNGPASDPMIGQLTSETFPNGVPA